MPSEQMHWRVAYSISRAYHIIASSNINENASILLKLNSQECKKYEIINGEIKPISRLSTIDAPNGLATILSCPRDESIEFKHVFIKNGKSIDAMNKMIALLDEQNSHKHIDPIIKF